MLKNKLLKKYVINYIHKVMPDVELAQINFCNADDNSAEGIYAYSQKNKYYFVFVEKGKVREKQELSTKKQVVSCILDTVLFDYAMRYATKNVVKGQDFRRILFNKEIELHSNFGSDFEQKKREEIIKILEKNPYIDK